MTQGKVLIVEDEFLIALNLKLEMESEGFIVCGIAADGNKAVELSRKNEPVIILMDIYLKGTVDGIEAARQIREFSSALIIFTTGFQEQSLKDRAMALKPAAFLIKPISVEEIKPIIASQLP
ncbi:response regulator [bacterium]|nr:response regulator [bacterium]